MTQSRTQPMVEMLHQNSVADLLILKPAAVIERIAIVPPVVRVASVIVEPDLVGGAPLVIPIQGSSVPGCTCANCPAVVYARNLEVRYNTDQRTIMALRTAAQAAIKGGAALVRLPGPPHP